MSKGVVAVFREFRNIKFKGKKHEVCAGCARSGSGALDLGLMR